MKNRYFGKIEVWHEDLGTETTIIKTKKTKGKNYFFERLNEVVQKTSKLMISETPVIISYKGDFSEEIQKILTEAV